MTRRTALSFIAIACLALPACAKVDKKINKKNFEAIKPGMTRSEVESLLGGPGEPYEGTNAGETSGAAVGVGIGVDLSSRGGSSLRWTRWGNDYTHILVCFLRDKVHDTEFKKEKGLK